MDIMPTTLFRGNSLDKNNVGNSPPGNTSPILATRKPLLLTSAHRVKVLPKWQCNTSFDNNLCGHFSSPFSNSPIKEEARISPMLSPIVSQSMDESDDDNGENVSDVCAPKIRRLNLGTSQHNCRNYFNDVMKKSGEGSNIISPTMDIMPTTLFCGNSLDKNNVGNSPPSNTSPILATRKPLLLTSAHRVKVLPKWQCNTSFDNNSCGHFSSPFSNSPIKEEARISPMLSPIVSQSMDESDDDNGENVSDVCAPKIRQLNLGTSQHNCRNYFNDVMKKSGEGSNIISPTDVSSFRSLSFENDGGDSNNSHYSIPVIRRVISHPTSPLIISPTNVSCRPLSFEDNGGDSNNFNYSIPAIRRVISYPTSPPTTRRKSIDHQSEHKSTSSTLPAITTTAPVLKRKSRICPNPNISIDTTNKTRSRLIQDFEVVGTLGEGDFGTVYSCISRLDRRPYAVKATKCQARGTSDRERMLREVHALAALSDSSDSAAFHIVRYHQAWMEENRLFIQTELCTSTLRKEMTTGRKGCNVLALRLDVTRQFKLLREMLLALDFVHRNGMVHLDIKPENIFVKNNQYKLGDFGLVAKSSVRARGVEGDVDEGDSRYMCLDLLQGNHQDLTKCDIFSLGATMYEITLGRALPAHGEEWQEIRSGKLFSLTHAYTEPCAIVRLMMNPKGEDRPTAAELLRRRQLLSKDEKRLVLERNKVREANMALAVKEAKLKELICPSRTSLKRSRTLN